MNADERAALLASQVGHRFLGGQAWTWSHRGIKYKVTDFSVIPKGVQVTVEVEGRQVSNPVRLINPPTVARGSRHAFQEMIEDAVG